MSSFPSRNYFYPLKKNTEMPANKEHKPSVDKKLENTVFVIYHQRQEIQGAELTVPHRQCVTMNRPRVYTTSHWATLSTYSTT